MSTPVVRNMMLRYVPYCCTTPLVVICPLLILTETTENLVLEYRFRGHSVAIFSGVDSNASSAMLALL